MQKVFNPLSSDQITKVQSRMQRNKLLLDIVRTFFWGCFVAGTPLLIIRLGISKPEEMPTFDPITYSVLEGHMPWLLLLWFGCLFGFWSYFRSQKSPQKELTCSTCGQKTRAIEGSQCECGGPLVDRLAIPRKLRPPKNTF